MTSKLLYEYVLIETDKDNAPNILLEEFNYLANKAINQYVNKRYNIYDVNQQTTDDLRVLKATAKLDPIEIDFYDELSLAKNATYYVDLPSDYLHMLNCICIYKVNKTYNCYNAGTTWRAAAKKLTSDAYSLVLDNFWNKPTYKNPYYFIHNINSSSYNPTNSVDAEIDKQEFGSDYEVNGTDIKLDKVLLEATVITDVNGVINIATENNAGKYFIVTYTYKDVENFYENDNDELTKTVYVNYIGELLLVVKNDNKISVEDVTDTLNASYVYDSVNKKYYIRKRSRRWNWEEVDSIDDVDHFGNIIYKSSNEPFTSITLGEKSSAKYSNVERSAKVRYGNASKVRCEIRYGTDSSVFTLYKVLIDYIKTPQFIRLTQDELDMTEDTSLVLEFPDYVCQEIVNELTHLIMEKTSNARLQTHPIVSLSIANPAQALAPEAAGQSAQ